MNIAKTQIYVIQLFPDKKLLHINYSSGDDPVERLDFIRAGKYNKAVLRDDLVKLADPELTGGGSLCKDLAHKLTKKGYICLDGGGLLNSYFQLYVIYVDNPKSNIVYVGSTAYPREVRFLQHKYGVRNARIFNKHKAFALAPEYYVSTKVYSSKNEVERAEKKLANSLRNKKLTVFQG